jgi:hypothetical protein
MVANDNLAREGEAAVWEIYDRPNGPEARFRGNLIFSSHPTGVSSHPRRGACAG